MQRQNYLNWALYVIVMALAMWWLGAGKPMKMQGLFIASGLAVGSLYALGGIGMVVLYRATGVLNFSSGAAGAAGAMSAWQLVEWAYGPHRVVGMHHRCFGNHALRQIDRAASCMARTRRKRVMTLGFALIILGLVSFS